jgi:thioredoxin 2
MVTYLEKGALPAGEGVSVVAFSAQWCPPCKVMEPIYEATAARFPGMRFLKANQEAVPELFDRYGVQAIPTYVVFKGGKEVHRQVGALPASRFEAMLGPFAG